MADLSSTYPNILITSHQFQPLMTFHRKKNLLGRHRHFNSLIQNEYEIKKIIDFSIYSTKVDQMYSEVVLSVSSKKKNLYLRRSQNNAYNHDGLVDSDAVSRNFFFLFLYCLTSSLSFSFCSLSSFVIHNFFVYLSFWRFCYYFIIILLTRMESRFDGRKW